MKRQRRLTRFHCWTLILAAVLAAVWCCGLGEASDPKAAKSDQKTSPKNRISLVELNDKLSRTPSLVAKAHQVTLTAAVRTERKKDATDDILIDWKIQYAGPRWPLNMIEPSLTKTTGSTFIEFYSTKEGRGDAIVFLMCSPFESPGENPYIVDEFWEKRPLPPPPNLRDGPFPHLDVFREMLWKRDFYLTIAKGEDAKGTLRVNGQRLKKAFLDENSADFRDGHTPKLYVKLMHSPLNRGDEFHLDAWTGDLQTPIGPVPALSQW